MSDAGVIEHRAPARDKHGLWQPGISPNPKGRELGSRNRLADQFVKDLYADWQEGGIAAIKEVRETKPSDYLKVVASILPKTLDVNINQYDQMSDDELVGRIRQLESIIRPFLAIEGNGAVDGGIEQASDSQEIEL